MTHRAIKSARRALVVIAVCLSPCLSLRAESSAAVIQDPDGYTNVRQEPDRSAKIVGRIRDKERFVAIPAESDWWEVYTPSGKHGFVHRSRVKPLPSEPLPRLGFNRAGILESLKETPEFDSLGIRYADLVREALDGKDGALRRFHDLATSASLDGAAAEIHHTMLWEVLHAVGDEPFAAFLKKQDQPFRRRIGEDLRSPFVTWPVEKPDPYLKEHFPAVWKVIGREPAP